MSIFNQITFAVLVAEISIFLLSLIPLNFVPVRSRKAFMQWSAKALANDSVVWIARFVLLLIGGVFVDTILRLQKLDSALHERHDHHHSPAESTLEDLQYKTKLFYSQRNMYLSLTSLFLILVLYRRIKDIYQILQLQEEIDSNKTTLKALKQQVEILIASSSKDDGGKKASSTTGTSSTIESKAEGSKVSEAAAAQDPTESSGIRKRK